MTDTKSDLRGDYWGRTIGNSPPEVVLDRLLVYKGSFVLGPLTVRFPAGAITAIVGPSGSGKSTLLRSVIGLEDPAQGAVWLGAEKMKDLSVAGRRIGFVFQDAFLYPQMTMNQNLAFPLRLSHTRQERIDSRISSVLEELGLAAAYLGRYAQELPQGIRQLFALGKSRIRSIDVLLMDEPLQHLETAVRREVRLILQQLVRNLGLTVVLSLTNPEDVLAMSDYVAVIDNGGLIEHGPTEQIYRCPGSLCAMEMLSPLGLNSFPVEVRQQVLVSLKLPARGCADGQWRLCFRPESAGPDGVYRLPFRLSRRAVFDGKRDVLEGEIAEQQVMLMWPRAEANPNAAVLKDYHLFSVPLRGR